MSAQRSDTAKRLAKRWKLLVKHALYRKTGDWYHQLEQFPGALLDEFGYVIFQSEEAYRSCPQLRIRQDVVVPNGIRGIPTYVLAPSTRSLGELEGPHDGATSVEGDRLDVLQSLIERDPKARAACIRVHGTACSVCGFCFAETYGEMGDGFIHVHHLRPLAEGVREVDPIEDLRPICPNCHAMIHRRTPPLSIEELSEVLLSSAQA